MNFEYAYTTTATADIEIDDIGNVCLLATDELFRQQYLLVIDTKFGESRIIEYGPIKMDSSDTLTKGWYTFESFEFKANRIISIIERFLNNPKRVIYQVDQIELDDAIRKMKGFAELL